MSAVLALLRPHPPNLIDSLGGHPRPVPALVAGLPAHFPAALLRTAPLSRFPCESIGGRRLGGVGGILLAQCQLPLQIRDLLLGVGDLLLLLGDLLSLLG